MLSDYALEPFLHPIEKMVNIFLTFVMKSFYFIKTTFFSVMFVSIRWTVLLLALLSVYLI